ncbi:MAG: hypothetical protein U0990_06570 [Candidatus Nanopelagicales bacterium]|nr:hypothetical protein [Candidatus Nanopelagicales bacterium]MDZ4249739.1 hypothetical protein [Candidatus Nanopelagicales bacterium]
MSETNEPVGSSPEDETKFDPFGLTQTAEIAPPDEAAPPTGAPGATYAAPPVQPSPGVTWHDMYTQEQRKTRALLVTTIVAAVLFFGAAAWGIGRASSLPVMGPVGMTLNGPDGPGGMIGRGPGGMIGGPEGKVRGPGGMRGSQGQGMLQRFFNEDGSLNKEAVAAHKDFLASQGSDGMSGVMASHLRRGLAASVASGQLSQAQADELLSALGVSATPSPSPTT